MTFVPENDLEKVLMGAAYNAALRPEFYRLLLEADLYVIGQIKDRGPGSGNTTIQPGEELQIAAGDANGRRFHPVFSALSRLQAFVRDESRYLALNGRSLFEATPGALYILNPGSDYGKELLPDEIAGLLHPAGPRTMTMDKQTKVLIGQPAVYPHDLVEALKSIFAKRPEILSAHLVQIAFEGGDTPPHPLIGVEVTGDWRGVSEEIASVVNAVVPGMPVDAIPITRDKPTVLVTELLKAAPFYSRPLSNA